MLTYQTVRRCCWFLELKFLESVLRGPVQWESVSAAALLLRPFNTAVRDALRNNPLFQMSSRPNQTICAVTSGPVDDCGILLPCPVLPSLRSVFWDNFPKAKKLWMCNVTARQCLVFRVYWLSWHGSHQLVSLKIKPVLFMWHIVQSSQLFLLGYNEVGYTVDATSGNP